VTDRKLIQFSSSALPGVEAYRVESSGPLAPRRLFGVFAIGTMIQGELDEYGRRAVHRFGPDVVLFVNPDEVFGPVKMRAPFEAVGLLIEPDVFRAFAKTNGVNGTSEPGWRRFSTTNAELAAAIVSATRAIESKAPMEEQRALFERVVSLVIPNEIGGEVETVSPARKSIIDVRDFLRARFAEKIMLQDLEVVSGLSRFHLVRRFTAEVGLPPHTYQVALRVDRARGLIRRGLSPVAVATAVGFADQSHLTRHFKRRVGMTPGAYAQAVLPRK